jgi:hypothetical protein
MWETLHLFSRFNQKSYVQATSSDEISISAYPTIDTNDDSMTVVLVNRSLTEKKLVNLTFNGYTMADNSFNMYSLSKLGSTETFVSHTKNTLVKSNVTCTSNQINVELAPLSVNSIQLRAIVLAAQQGIQRNDYHASAYPNPADDVIHLDFSLPETARLNIGLFGVNGQQLKIIRNEVFSAGNHQIDFNSASLLGGIYWIKFVSSKNVKTVKLIKK